MRRLVAPVAAVVAVLAGCVATKETRTPDGKVAYEVNCSGNAFEWENCHEKARSLCGARGYTIVAGGPESGVRGPRDGGLFSGTDMARRMVVQCRD
jgi:hypothetical protein